MIRQTLLPPIPENKKPNRVRPEDENATSQNFTGANSARNLCANKAVVAPPGIAPTLSRAIQATAHGHPSGIVRTKAPNRWRSGLTPLDRSRQ
jgi:hypothetical protein